MPSWNCQLCSGKYVALRDLVSHVRAAHSSEVNYICGVRGCLRTFRRTSTWYKHIQDSHYEDYQNTNPEVLSNTPEGDNHEVDAVQVPMDTFDSFSEEVPTSYSGGDPPSEKAMAAKLIRIKEYHNLSQVAVDDIVDLVQTVCDDSSMKAMSAIRHCGEHLGMDISSTFFQEISEIFQNLNYPLSSVETAYKQQLFVINNLPYVVCSVNSLS